MVWVKENARWAEAHLSQVKGSFGALFVLSQKERSLQGKQNSLIGRKYIPPIAHFVMEDILHLRRVDDGDGMDPCIQQSELIKSA
jgi:hypothetical protein